MILGKNLTFLQLFFLGKKAENKRFSDLLDITTALLEYKNINLKRSQNLHFPKGLVNKFG